MTQSIDGASPMQLGNGLEQLARTPISAVPFVSEEFFDRERAIWKDSWLMLGREADVRDPGQYITFDLKVLNTSVIVIRTHDNILRAFHNICPHRAGRLLWEPCGTAASIVCRYHGWSYGLDGSFRGAPEPQLFDNLKADERYNLRALVVDIWGGFLFVNLNPNPTYTLPAYLSGLPSNLGTYLMDPSWHWYTGYQSTFDANWKDLMNVQHEGYHASHIHKKTLGVDFPPEDCRNTVFPDSPGVCSLLQVLRPVMSKEFLARMSVVQKLSLEYGTTSNWVNQDTSRAAELVDAVNHTASERWVFDCYTFYPNLLLFVGTDVLSVMRVWPLSTHRADWEWDWYFKDELQNFGNLFNREHGRLATRNALSEDWPVCEQAHRNLRSGILEETPIASDMEATVRALYEKVLAHMGLTEAELRHVGK